MSQHGPDGRATDGGGSEMSQCGRCGTITAIVGNQCPACLLRMALECDGTEPEIDAIEASAGRRAERPRGATGTLRGYQIVDEIGRGGMGVIYRAVHEKSGAVVAVKCLLDYHADSPETVARFRREAAGAASLRHPNILPVYEVGNTADGLPFFSMQVAAGGTLQAIIRTARPDARRSAALIQKVATAVHYAHDRGILHRDLKPANILLDGVGEPFVCDFGLAKWLNEPDGLTRTLLVFGTPGYIAPEQAHGPAADIDRTADVYSLGAILFELLTGQPPFLGDHALAVLRKAAEQQAPRVRSLAPQLDRELETICARCLEREPAARYRTAAALAADLERWLTGRRIAARRVGAGRRLWRSSRRNPVLTGALALALVCSASAALHFMSNRGLRQVADERLLAARSVLLLPIVDLDNATVDPVGTEQFARSFATALNAHGPARLSTGRDGARVAMLGQRGAIEAAAAARARTVVALTRRSIDRGVRYSLRVLDGATAQPLHVARWDAPAANAAGLAAGGAPIPQIYALISRAEDATLPEWERDPGFGEPDARHAIESARQLMFSQSSADLDQAIALLQQAVQVQPNSAKARAYLSSAYTGKAFFAPHEDLIARAEIEARRSIELAPAAADGHRSLAGVLFQKGDLHGTLEHLLQTAESFGVDENLATFLAGVLDSVGAVTRAVRWYEVALASTKLPAPNLSVLGDCWTKLDHDEKALQAYRRASELQPGLPHADAGVARVYMLRGEFDKARAANVLRAPAGDFGFSAQLAAQIELFAREFGLAEQQYRQLAQTEPGGGGAFFGALDYESALARCLQALDRSADAEELLVHSLAVQQSNVARQPRHPEALYRLAAVEAMLGLKQSSLDHIHDAVNAGWLDHRSLKMDPRFDRIRAERRFQNLLVDLAGRALLNRKALEQL